nr:VP0 [Feline sakobuvirus A]
GNSQTNIYGNNNHVTTDVGANGNTPTASVSVGEGAVSSASDSTTHNPLKGGSSTAPKDKEPGKPDAKGNISTRRYHAWWEPAAAKALDRALDHGVRAVDSVADGVASGIQAGVGKIKQRVAGVQDTKLIALPQNDATMSGNTVLAAASGIHSGATYPPTPSVPLPTPDAPSCPGPSGDRFYPVDNLSWSEADPIDSALSGPNACSITPLFPLSNSANWGDVNTGSIGYPLPASFVKAAPDCPWTAMYNMHAMWNSGFHVVLTVNASQFHEGALVLYAFPENTYTNSNNPRCNFTVPYAVLNLTQTTQAELDLPYIAPTPNSTTMGMHSPWYIVVGVLSPLLCPVGSSSTSVGVTLQVSPKNSSFHGLRHVQP